MTTALIAESKRQADYRLILEAMERGASPNWHIAAETGIKLSLVNKRLIEMERLMLVTHPHRGCWMTIVKVENFPLIRLKENEDVPS